MDKSDLTVTNVLYPDAPALQAVWPDDLGSYPWEESYTLAPEHQFVKGVHDPRSTRVDSPRVIYPHPGMNRAHRARRPEADVDAEQARGEALSLS